MVPHVYSLSVNSYFEILCVNQSVLLQTGCEKQFGTSLFQTGTVSFESITKLFVKECKALFFVPVAAAGLFSLCLKYLGCGP